MYTCVCNSLRCISYIHRSNLYPNVFLFMHYYNWLLALVGVSITTYFLSVGMIGIMFVVMATYSNIIVFYWFRDFLREYNKRISLLTAYVVAIFLTFVAEESLLFISFFWSSYHHLLSPLYNFCEGLIKKNVTI